ncbi:hypothetical protein [Streptomyces sp. NEAU-H3]|uniref:hypothetical protein n=1 Tax=Streptomyces sp. NEAU-H3 TaxID=2720636 RepID=UPI001FD760DB|nr:hypothetical protein [Streptomyces sp. NEAU-H3]
MRGAGPRPARRPRRAPAPRRRPRPLVELDPRNAAEARAAEAGARARRPRRGRDGGRGARTELLAPGGTLVWTRNRKAPDRVPRVCDWLEARGFTRDSLSPPDVRQAVAAHRRTGPAAPLPPPHTPLFAFVGYDVLAEREGRDG